MTMLAFSLRPTGDWDPQGYAAEEEGEDLAALGMRTKEEGKEEEDDELDEDGEKKVVVPVKPVEEDDEVDELKTLERLEKALKNDEMGLNVVDPEDE